MTQSVLGRLTTSHLLVALASVLLVAALSSHLFSVYYVNQRRNELVGAAESLAHTAADLLLRRDREQLHAIAGLVGDVLGGRVCVFEARDAQLIASSHAGVPDEEKNAARDYLRAHLNTTSAETTQVECQGLVYRVTVPVRERASDELIGLVVLHCPIAGIQQIVTAQRITSALAAGGAGLLAVLLALIVSKATRYQQGGGAAGRRRL